MDQFPDVVFLKVDFDSNKAMCKTLGVKVCMQYQVHCMSVISYMQDRRYKSWQPLLSGSTPCNSLCVPAYWYLLSCVGDRPPLPCKPLQHVTMAMLCCRGFAVN